MLTLFPIFHFMNVMLTLLFGIQVFWTWYLLKMVFNALTSGGKVLRDERSFSEGTISESEHDKKKLWAKLTNCYQPYHKTDINISTCLVMLLINILYLLLYVPQKMLWVCKILIYWCMTFTFLVRTQ